MYKTQIYNLDKAFSSERKILLSCGLYPNQDSINKFLYYLAATFNVIMALYITLSMVIYIISNIENITSIAEALLFLLTQLGCLCKMLNVYLKKDNLLKIEEIVSNLNFYGQEKVEIIKHHVYPTTVFGIVFRTMCYLVWLCYGVFPMINEKEWALPLPGWNPIEIDNKFNYVLVFGIQWVSYFLSIYVNSGIDMMVVMLITVATSQFEILKDNLTNIRYDTKEAKKEFDKNVVFHYEILKFIHIIEDTFTYGTVVQFFVSALVICFTGFEMMILPANSIQFVTIGMYFNNMTLQVAMYCWFGNNIIASSDKINQSIYMSNWYKADNNTKKSIMIFMEKCKKPVVLTAGKIFPLSLVTFISIMRSSYSYFTVLQRLYGPQ